MNRRIAIQGALAGMIGTARSAPAQQPAVGAEVTKLPDEPLLAAARVMRPVSRPTDSPPNPSCYQAGAFHPSGRLLITAEVDCAHVAADVSWFILPGNEPMLTLPGREPTLSVWDVQAGWAIRSTGGHPARITCIGLDPEGKRVLVGGGTRMELPKGPAPQEESRQAPSGPRGGAMSAYDLATGELLEAYPRSASPVVAVCWGSQKISSLDSDSVFSVRPPGRREPSLSIETARGPGQPLRAESSVGFSADGERAVALSDKLQDVMRSDQIGSTIFLWDALHGSGRERVASESVVSAIALAPAGTIFATAEKDGMVRIRGFDDFKVIRNIASPHRQGIIHLAFDPDGRRIAAATYAGEVTVWDVADGRLISSGKGPDGRVLASVFLAKQVRLATSEPHPDRPIPAERLQVWDLELG